MNWKKQDPIYFIVFSFICFLVQNMMIFLEVYKGMDFNNFWLVASGLGLISFVFFLVTKNAVLKIGNKN